MSGLTMVYSSLLLGTVILCLINIAAGYPTLEEKEKEYTDTDMAEEKSSSDQLLDKRIFDPIEAASSFGSFGKRYNGYRVMGYNKDELNTQRALEGIRLAELLKRVLAMAMAKQGQYSKRLPEAMKSKRQFDPIGYGMFARFG